MIRLAIGLVLLMLAGSATAQEAQPQKPAIPKAAAAKRAGGTRIIITRADTMFYMGSAAQIEVRGAKVAELWRGQTYAGSVKPGPLSITTKAFLAPGEFTVSFNAQPGRTYKFLLSPRSENFMASAVVGFGLAGMVATHIEGKGPFKLEPMK